MPVLKRIQGVQAGKYPDATRQDDYIDTRPQIVRLLEDHYSKSKRPILEILCKESNYSQDKKMNFIFDKGDRLITVGELLEREWGIRRNTVTCPKCKESMTTDTILYHLESGFRNGHKFNIEGITNFLSTISN